MKKQFEKQSDTTNAALTCPKCGSTISSFKLGHRCSNKECGFWIPREIRQKVLTEKTVRELVEKGETGLIKGFHKRGNSQTFEARLYISDNWKIKFQLDELREIKCPKCRSCTLVRFQRGFRCKDEADCGYILWNRFGGKELTDDQMIMLVKKGKTDVMSGFISKKNGKRYSARIMMGDQGDLRVHFDDNGTNPKEKSID